MTPPATCEIDSLLAVFGREFPSIETQRNNVIFVAAICILDYEQTSFNKSRLHLVVYRVSCPIDATFDSSLFKKNFSKCYRLLYTVFNLILNNMKRNRSDGI